MRYMGSKRKFINTFAPMFQKIIRDNNITTYIEPFCGGCAIIKNIACPNRLAYDKSDTLIALLQRARDNFAAIPVEFSDEIWEAGKAYKRDGAPLPDNIDLADVGAMEWFGSFSNRGFPGGRARSKGDRKPYAECRASLEKDVPQLQGIEFGCQDYWELDPNIKDCFIYCDIPYQGTKTYTYKRENEFDYTKFWDWVRDLSKSNWVFVSEQTAPDDFECVWQQETNRTVGLNNKYKATEKLFRYKGGRK